MFSNKYHFTQEMYLAKIIVGIKFIAVTGTKPTRVQRHGFRINHLLMGSVYCEHLRFNSLQLYAQVQHIIKISAINLGRFFLYL